MSGINTLDNIYNLFLQSNGICTDTRKLNNGEIFFALKGPNFNANTYATSALDLGAAYVIIDDTSFKKDERYIVVGDVLHTLQDLAAYHRAQFKIPVIGLTGSNGKTTTKELINLVLQTKYRVAATTGNLNNHIGVPLTLLRIDKKTEIAIVEMGANHVGEIAFLCSIARPTHGLITNIGRAHLEGFGSIEGVLRAKSELYQFLIENDGTVFINSKDPVLMNMSKRVKNSVLYPSVDDFNAARFISSNPAVTFASNGITYNSKLIGEYNFSNINTALCVARYFDVAAEDASKAIEDYCPDDNRSQLLKIGTNTLIMDAYNANPESMNAAILNFENMEAAKKIVILGDMFELGSYAKDEHKKIGDIVNACHFYQCYFVGDEMKYAHPQVQGSLYFQTKSGLDEYLNEHSIQNATILLKASRGIGLETLLDKFK